MIPTDSLLQQHVCSIDKTWQSNATVLTILLFVLLRPNVKVKGGTGFLKILIFPSQSRVGVQTEFSIVKLSRS